MLNELQKRTAQAIVNIFETGQVQGHYGQVTLLQGDSGHLTYGRSQTTLASGNLFLLIRDYCRAQQTAFGAELSRYLPRLQQRDLSLDHDVGFKELLREAGRDPEMHKIQDTFFDRVYWEPCLKSAELIHAQLPLGVGIIYDSRIHGSWAAMRRRTNESAGELQAIGEENWFSHYVNIRHQWLATHSNALLHKTVYRMENFERLIQSGNWDLQLPVTVHGVIVDEVTLTQSRTLRVSAESEDERILMLQDPFLKGDDVRQIQRALLDAGIQVAVDSVFGSDTDKAVRAFQQQNNLAVDGVVGPATRASLGL